MQKIPEELPQEISDKIQKILSFSDENIISYESTTNLIWEVIFAWLTKK